jgi:hypothetical protein
VGPFAWKRWNFHEQRGFFLQRRIAMPDSKSSKPGPRSCARILTGKCHQLNYFRCEYQVVSKANAEKIIKKARRNRERANEMAITLFLSINIRNTAVRGLEAGQALT